MFTDVVIFITLAHWFVYFYFLFPYFFIYFLLLEKKIEWIWKRDDTSASDLENGDQLNSSGAHSWRALKASHELEKNFLKTSWGFILMRMKRPFLGPREIFFGRCNKWPKWKILLAMYKTTFTDFTKANLALPTHR